MGATIVRPGAQRKRFSAMSKSSREALKSSVPIPAVNYCSELLDKFQCTLRITRPRSTKIGDYKAPHGNLGHRITVNSNLNQYNFLVTLIHEIAHLVVWNQYKSKVKPHGKEWQNQFRELMEPLLGVGIFPPPLDICVKHHVSRGYASTFSDRRLLSELRKYDGQTGAQLFVKDLALNERFTLKGSGREFVKGPLVRTRYRCRAAGPSIFKKYYSVHPMAEVETS